MKESNTSFALQTSHWQVTEFLRNTYTIWASVLKKILTRVLRNKYTKRTSAVKLNW